MAIKTMTLFAVLAVCVSFSIAGVVPVAPAAYVAPYASSYNAHIVNHAIATPVAAPLVAAPAAVAPYSAAYSAYPYSAYPYSYSAPLILGR